MYLDWLRGFAVAIMVEAHVVDAWTRGVDREGLAYFVAVFLAGMAAPLFLFLAGVSLALAASARAAKAGVDAAAASAAWRGAQVFALAFLFRLQSQLLGWGALMNFLKVDILNVMGLAMVGTAALWGLTSSRRGRLAILAMVTAGVAMLTPIVREAGWVAMLPDPIEWYLRPAAGRTTFTLFPWAAFLLAGAMVGELAAAAPSVREERRLQAALMACGLIGAALAYWASFQPSIYPVSSFWTSSPTFFFLRLGLVTTLVPIAWACARLLPLSSAIETFGRSSLFVYWIHVEMVYGLVGRPLRRLLPLPVSLVATVALCALLYVIVQWKNRLMSGVELPRRLRILAPVLK